MRIFLATGIYPPESGGPATYTAGLASAFRAQGHTVEVLAYGNPDLKDPGVTRVSRTGGAIIRYVRYAWQAFRLARRSDVVYAQGPVSEGLPTMIGAWFAGRSVTMKVVGDYAWEMAMQRGEKDLLDPFLTKRHGGVIGWYERIERWTARRAYRVIVPSRYLKTVVERWGVPNERIQIIVNANEPMPETRGRTAERRALGVEDRVVILTAVRAVPWKGVAELMASLKDLPPSHLLVVAGDGPMFDDWSLLAEKLGVQDRVRMLGRIDRATLAKWYEAADAFALNSGYEGYPHVVAEAASFGVPCFVSDQGGNPETKETFGDLVRILPYADVAAWTNALSAVTRRADTALVVAEVPSYEEMVTKTLATLHGKRDPLSIVMVSYDRELLDASSTTSKRVQSLADETTAIHPIVMQGRIVRTILRGVCLIRASSKKAIVTAQDPFAAGLVGYVTSRWTNVPLEIQEHGDFFSGAWIKESWKNRVLFWVGRFMLKRAERVRAVSDRVRQDLMRLGVEAHRIDVIPVAQDVSRLLEMPLRSMADVPRIVVPCRFVEQKGLDVLLEAASKLKQDNLSFALSLIGSGPLQRSLERRIKTLGLSDRVSIEAWRDPVDVWNDADLFVMSSRYEGFGRTITEAMAAGVPIVTTEVGCVGSVFRPQIDGRVVQPNDPRGLAAAIREQLREPERREAMRIRARDQVRTIAGQAELHAQQRLGWGGMHQEGDTGPRFELWVGAFLAFAVLSRIASVILFHDSLVNREWGFFYLVDHWFQGFGYSYARELGCASAYRSPGYLFFLTGLYAIFSPTNTLAHAIVQNMFVVGVLWLVYVVGRRFVGKRAALIGGLLMACYPYTFYHYTQYYHTFLSSFFLLLLVWCALRLTETKRYAWAVASGAAIAALAYVQGTILPATPFIVLWLFWKLWPEWKRVIGCAAIMAIVSAVLIAPWTYRNWKELHAFVPLTTDLGHAVFKANNENIYQLTLRGYPQEIVDYITVSSTNPMYKQYRMPPDLEAELTADGVYRESVNWTEWHPREPNGDVATCAELGPLDEVEFNRYWTEKGSAWLKENWWPEGLKLQLLKLKTFWQPSLFPSVKTGAAWSFADSPVKVWLARNVMAAASAVVIIGGLLGIFFAVRRRDKNVWLPIVFLVVYSIMHTFFAGYTKYRIPLDNLLAMYAGWTLLAIWNRIRGRSILKQESHDEI
jgi:glycosyltransferase involved in cell wall biosynthesis/4-amino-4-deoxy-L-arabinose transferase-like glycosyltransferase